jgi:NodT family efflux transporter outer membrane factor (OMF) lipoprotein
MIRACGCLMGRCFNLLPTCPRWFAIVLPERLVRPSAARIAARGCLGFRRSVGLALIVGLLSACAEAPERQPVVAAGGVPQRWTAVAASPDASSGAVKPWLASFRDVDLLHLVQTALAGNFELKALVARIEQARSLAVIEGSRRKPQLEFAPGLEHLGVGGGGAGSLQGGTAWEVPFNISWEIDLWGRILAAQLAAEADADAVRTDVTAAVLSLSARTVQSCFELAEARQQVHVVEENIAQRRAVAQLARGRFSLGLSDGLDLSLALTDLTDAEAQLAEAHNRVQISARLLQVLLGRYPKEAISGCTALPGLPPRLPSGVPADLLARRPDVVAAFIRLRAEDQRLVSARKALLPRLTLTGSGGTQSAALEDFIEPRGAVWNIAVGLAQPLFTGGRLTAEIEYNAARVEEETNRYRETVLNALREVEQSLAAETWLLDRERALIEAVRLTGISHKLAVRSYRNGSIAILTLLDSYRSTLAAQSALLDVRRQILTNRVALYLALGGAA